MGSSYTLDPLEDTLVLVNQRRERFSPFAEYTQSLTELPNSEGYILFPRSATSDCYPTVNILNDHSFDIRLTKYNLMTHPQYDELIWPYTLLPDIPIEEALNIPPANESTELDRETLNQILGLALSIIDILLV